MKLEYFEKKLITKYVNEDNTEFIRKLNGKSSENLSQFKPQELIPRGWLHFLNDHTEKQFELMGGC